MRWTPTDNLEFNTRGNERSYRRRMGGADAAGIVNLTENGGMRDPVTGNKRNTTSFAMGYREVGHDPVVLRSSTGRNPACTVTGATLQQRVSSLVDRRSITSRIP